MCRVTSPQVRPTRSLRRNAPANPINSKAVGTYNNDGVGSNVRCQSLISATWAFQPFAGSFVGFLGAWTAETCLVRASYRHGTVEPIAGSTPRRQPSAHPTCRFSTSCECAILTNLSESSARSLSRKPIGNRHGVLGIGGTGFHQCPFAGGCTGSARSSAARAADRWSRLAAANQPSPAQECSRIVRTCR